MPHISIKAEQILNFFGFPITNSLILSWIVMIIFLFVARFYSAQLQMRHRSRVFYLLHSVFMGIHGLFKSILHEKSALFYPLLGAYFFYILFNNWLGLMPTVGSLLIRPQVLGEVHATELSTPHETQDSPQHESTASPAGIEREDTVKDHAAMAQTAHEEHKIPFLRANNADLNTTLALALITVFFIQYYGIKYNGASGYLKKFFNFSSPILFFVGILELISEISRILSFSFRLFGNVLAGEVLISIVAFLLPSYLSFALIPFFALELMAGAIQALVFTMISTVLIGMATQKAHH